MIFLANWLIAPSRILHTVNYTSWRVIQRVAQQRAVTRVMRSHARSIEEEQKRHLSSRPPTQLDYRHKLESDQILMRDAGIDPNQIQTAIVGPIERAIDKLARFNCEGLITGMAVDFLEEQRPSPPAGSEE